MKRGGLKRAAGWLRGGRGWVTANDPAGWDAMGWDDVQRAQFARDGCVVLRNVLSAQQLDRLNAVYDREVDGALSDEQAAEPFTATPMSRDGKSFSASLALMVCATCSYMMLRVLTADVCGHAVLQGSTPRSTRQL